MLNKVDSMAKPLHTQTPLKRLLSHIQLEKNDIRRLIILTISIGVLSLATPVAIQALVNIVTMGGVLEPLYIVSFMLFLILCLSGSLYVLERYIVEVMQRRFFVRTAMHTASQAQSAKADIHDEFNSAELMNRFFDVITVQKSAATLLTYGLSATLQGIIGSIVLMFYSFYFALVVLIILIVIYFLVFYIGKHATETAIQESKSKYKVAGWLELIARNLITFKFLNGSKYGLNKADQLSNDYLLDRQAHFHTLLIQNISGVMIYAFAGTAMLTLGGALVIQGQINLGQFVAAELIIFSVLVAYRKFVEYLEYYYDLLAAIDKLGMIDDLPQEAHGQHILQVENGLQLNVNQIAFAYHSHKNIFENLSFSLPPNSSMCIFGPSGSGKSTIAEIITGLRTPNSGQIEINGIDIRSLDLSHTRLYIGYAGQIEIIEASILENIIVGRKDISIEKVSQVLKSLSLYESIFNLPNGLETSLTPSGAPLSTQQAQLLMLARVLVSEPKLVVIDELLDGLDTLHLSKAMDILQTKTWDHSLIVFTRIQTIADCFEHQIRLKNV